MAWFTALLLITGRYLQKSLMPMCVTFVHARRRDVTMVDTTDLPIALKRDCIYNIDVLI